MKLDKCPLKSGSGALLILGKEVCQDSIRETEGVV